MPSQEPNPEGTPRAVFGAMLRWYRQQAGLSQDVLGTRAHMSGKTISAYENGWRVPTRPACVEVACPMPAVVKVRDSKDPEGPVLAFPAAVWQAFTSRLKSGDLHPR
jgi:DNA-binding XRE family transcriptional regulator